MKLRILTAVFTAAVLLMAMTGCSSDDGKSDCCKSGAESSDCCSSGADGESVPDCCKGK